MAFLFCYGDEKRSQASGGGRGLGAGAHPGGEEASATREKTRSVGSEHASARGDYVFDRAMKNPTPATKSPRIYPWGLLKLVKISRQIKELIC